MPELDLTIPEGALSDNAKRDPRSISWTHLHELPEGAMHTADGVAEYPQAVVDVTTPQGALSDRRRGELVKELTALILDATGWGEDAALRVWILCREIDEGSWGAGGGIVRYEQLKAAAKAEREKAEAAPA